MSVDLFCRVVDNFGDIGVCWRLARGLTGECGVPVRLWVDDIVPFSRIEPRVDAGLDFQRIGGVSIHHWSAPFNTASYTESSDVVIEAFACNLPEEVIMAMAVRPTPPVWINLEYLSAEDWVEECHALPSLHPATGLKKYFFFPGFTKNTGGLLREDGLIEARNAFQTDEKSQNLWRRTHSLPELDKNYLDISLFCYKNASISQLLEVFGRSPRPLRLFVPAGVASDALAAWAGHPLAAGEVFTKGDLILYSMPFLPQTEYDRLLWTSHLNFVRGEDSLVRGIWAGRPLIWNIYPQEEDAHLIKLSAFLARISQKLDKEARETLADFHAMWNEGNHLKDREWTVFMNNLPQLTENARTWASDIGKRLSLAEALLSFAEEKAKSNCNEKYENKD